MDGKGQGGSPPPSGPPPVPFRPDVKNSGQFIAILTTFFTLSLIVWVARVYTRAKILKNFWWDDWVMVLTIILAIVEYSMNMALVPLGYGRHIEYIPPADITQNGKIGYIGLLVWVWVMTCLKTSMALMLLRIKRSHAWKWGLWILTAAQLAAGVATTFTHFLRCIPLEGNWNPVLPGAKCWSKENNLLSYYVLSGYFVANDFIFALLPITFIYNIRRPLREKVILILLMGSGLFATACAAVKIAGLRTMAYSNDPFFDGTPVGTWAHLEEYIGIIAACVPCLKAPFEQALQRFGLLSTKGGTGYSSGYPKNGYMQHGDRRQTKSKSRNSKNPFDVTTDSDVELVVNPETGRIERAEHDSEC